mmetsp:Transcript_40640/g.107446  ORF Transcript_40640/g.107446 Transcript_40640/m.107446 type:complete len:684 (+) Transcript_40640:69-2120(+)
MRFHSESWIQVALHPVAVFGVPVAWVFAVYGLASYMTTQKAMRAKQLMQVYNVIQILLCAHMVWGLMPCIRFPNIFGLRTEFSIDGEWFVFVHYLSKFLDWFDTLWIILKKNRRQLSFLHVFHHATIPMVWGFLLRQGVGSGTIRYGAWINSLTHVLMYSHYLWTSFGFRNPMKKFLSMWQIAQFYSCILHAVIVWAFETTDGWRFAWLQLAYQFSMVYLFSKKMDWVPECTPDLVELEMECETVISGCRYVIIRGTAYDVTNFNHPGGKHMLDLAIGRDATIMFESMHVRTELAEAMLKKVPQAPAVGELQKQGYTFDQGGAEGWSTPSQSELYQTIRKRIIQEVLEPIGRSAGAAGARGVPALHVAAVLVSWSLVAVWFLARPSCLNGSLVGLTMCWVGLAVQHTANHGGIAKSTNLGYLLGLLNDVIPGGSSLVWRYHHQVSHHSYCNDVALDQDAHSSFPLLRMDRSQKLEPYHRHQWLYGPVLFCGLWASIHMQDLICLLDARSFLVRFRGTSSTEIVLAILLKLVHVAWFYVVPALIHGPFAMLLPWFSALSVGSFCLASLFIISHNILEAKQAEEPLAKNGCGDWARYQIETTSSWGGAVGSFFTGGLNLQIEHHLFPGLPHHLYTQVQKITQEECSRRGLKYNAYPTLLSNFADHVKFLYEFGRSSPMSVIKKLE